MSIDLFIGRRPGPATHVFRIDSVLRSSDGRRFEVQDRIASGGNGVVHACTESVSGDVFAVKFQLMSAGSRADRFRREIRLLKSVRHDHLIAYRAEGAADARERLPGYRDRGVSLPFVVMDRADGNLRAIVSGRKGPLSQETYVGQFRGLCRALQALHDKAVHRDIKPENILVAGERWVISDLGLCSLVAAKESDALTHEHEPVGPRYWMSPEAVNRMMGNADVIQKASDVFQLASVFWYVVMGRHPSGVVRREDWNGPAALFDVLYRCLLHDHRARPNDGREFAETLDAALARGAEA